MPLFICIGGSVDAILSCDALISKSQEFFFSNYWTVLSRHNFFLSRACALGHVPRPPGHAHVVHPG